MKLVAKQHLHLADEYAKRKGKRVREVGKGEEFDVQDKEAPQLLDRGLAVKPSVARDEAVEKAEKVAEAEEKAGLDPKKK